MAEPARPEPKVFLDPEQVARGPEWYRATYFPHARSGQLLGEKSTSYLDVPAAADAARRVLGDPMVLVQLRDPVARAVSHWSFSTEQGLERRPLDRGPRGQPGGAAAVGRLGCLGVAVRLPRARALREIACGPGSRRTATGCGCCSSRTCSPIPATLTETYAWLGVDPRFRPPSTGTPVNASREDTAPSARLGLTATPPGALRGDGRRARRAARQRPALGVSTRPPRVTRR